MENAINNTGHRLLLAREAQATVIKRPKSSEQQPSGQARHNQQHSSTSTCSSTVHHFLMLSVYPSGPHLQCSLTPVPGRWSHQQRRGGWWGEDGRMTMVPDRKHFCFSLLSLTDSATERLRSTTAKSSTTFDKQYTVDL